MLYLFRASSQPHIPREGRKLCLGKLTGIIDRIWVARSSGRVVKGGMPGKAIPMSRYYYDGRGISGPTDGGDRNKG